MAVRLSPEDIYKAVQNRGTRLPAMPTGLPTLPTTPRGVGGIDRAGMAAAIAASGGRAAQQGAQRGGGGFGGFLGKTLGVIDLPRAIFTSGVKEIKDAFDGEGFSWGDFTQQARTHYGFGDFLHDENIDLGKWGNRAVGLAGDILLDPLSWTGGLGAFARARGARGLVDDLAPLVKDLGELGVRDAGQQATLRAAQDAVVAAGGKGGSVSRARNVLARQHGEAGKKLIDDLGIETGLRFRIPGTGPVLGRLTRDSAGIARKRASQIPRLIQERMKTALGPDVDLADLVFKAQKRQPLDQIPEEFRQVLQRAANVPVDVLPFGVFPIASGVTASIMSSPGIGWEKVASSRFGQTFREFFVDPQKKYLDNLARGRGATDEKMAGRQKARDRKKVATSLRRTKDPDKIILANFLRNSYNRGSMTSGYWADSAMRRRKIFLNEVQQNVGRMDDDTLGRLTELSPELVDDFADGVVSPQVMDSVRGRFPGLSDEQILFVVRRYDELIRTPDAEFLSRGDLYGSEGQLVNDMNDVMVDFGGYTPEIWTPDGLEIVRGAHGGGLPPWMEGVSREFEEVLPDARTMDEVRQRATSGRLRRRNMRPAGTRADGTFDGGTELVIPKADGSGSVRRLLRRSNPQRADVQQRVVGQGPDGRSTVIRRDLSPEELATRGRRPARDLTIEPEGLSIPEQIEAAYREAGWLDEGESLFVRGFEARENAHINSLAADIRLRSIESYAASQGLIYNADTYGGYARELADLEEAVAVGNEALQGLTDDEVAAQAVVDAILAVGAGARAQTIENLEAWVARHGGDAVELQGRVDELTRLLGEGRVEASDLTREVSEIVADLQDILGYRRVATTPRVPGGATPATRVIRQADGSEIRILPLDPVVDDALEAVRDTTLGWLNSDIPFEDLVAAPPGANPVAFSIDAIRVLAPILEDLDSVMVRARTLTEGVAKFAKLSDDITTMATTDPASALPETFLAGLQGLDTDIRSSLEFLENDLLPFAASLSNEAMLHDDTIVAVEALRRASEWSGGTQNIDADDLFEEIRQSFITNMGFSGTTGSSTFPVPSDDVLRVGVDAPLYPPATAGTGPDRTARELIESALSAQPERAAMIIRSIETLRNVRRDVARAVGEAQGLDVSDADVLDALVSSIPMSSIVSPRSSFSSVALSLSPMPGQVNTINVTFGVFGDTSRRTAGWIAGTNIEIDPLWLGKIRSALGDYMESVVLYEADRLGATVVASGGIVEQGYGVASLVDESIMGSVQGGERVMSGGPNGLYTPIRARLLPDADGNMQVVWTRPTRAPEVTNFMRQATRLVRTGTSGMANVRSLVDDGDLILPTNMYGQAIEEIIDDTAHMGSSLESWVKGEAIDKLMFDWEADFNRHFFYGQAGLRTHPGNRPLDVGALYGVEVRSGPIGLDGYVRPEDIVPSPNGASGGAGRRAPTVPGAVRHAQGGIYRAEGGVAVPYVLDRRHRLGPGPPPAAPPLGVAVDDQVQLLEELGVLENVLNVNYLSNLPGLNVGEVQAAARVVREGLAATAEQTWGAAGLQRYMPFLLADATGQPVEAQVLRQGIDLPEMRQRLENLQESLEDQISGHAPRVLANDAPVDLSSGVQTNAGSLRDFVEAVGPLNPAYVPSGSSATPAEAIGNDLLTRLDAMVERVAYNADARAIQVVVGGGPQYQPWAGADFWGAWNRVRSSLAMGGDDLTPGDVFNALDAEIDGSVWAAVLEDFRERSGITDTADHYMLSLLDPDNPAIRDSGQDYMATLSEYARVRVGDLTYNPAAVAVGGSAFTAPIPQQIGDVIYDALETGVGIRSNEYWDAIQSVLDNWGVPNEAFERSELIEWGYLVQQYDNLRAANFQQATFMAEERLYGAFDDAVYRSLDDIAALEDQIATASDPAARAASQGRLDARRATLDKKELLVQKIRLQRNAMEQQILLAEQQRNDLANKIGTMLGPTNGKPFNLNSFGGQVDLSGVTASQLQDLFNAGGKQMWGSGAMDQWLVAGNPEFADEFTYAMLAAQKMDDRVEVANFLKAYDRAHNWLKAQMVATPGFVARNVFGGMANMWFADIPLTETLRTGRLLSKAYKAGNGDLAAGFRKLVADNPGNVEYANALELVQLGVHGGGQAASVVDVNLGRTSRMDWVWGSKENSKYSGRIRANPMDAGFFLFAGVRHTNTFAEEMMRLGTALHVRRVGGSIDDALEMTYKLHFNYGGLSEAERRFGKRVFPFYTWTRNNLPLQVSFLANSPGKFNRLMSLRRNIELGEEREGVVPDYFMQGFGLQLPFSIGGAQAYSQPDFPLQDLFKFDPTQRGYSKVMEQMFSSTTPFLKTPIEYWAGKRVFEGIPFREEYVPVPVAMRMIPGLMQAAKVLGWAKKNKKGEWMMYDNRLAVLDNMMPFIGRLRRVIPEDEKTQSRWIQSMMSTFGGVSLRLNTPREQRNERVRRRVEREMTRQDRQALDRPRR